MNPAASVRGLSRPQGVGTFNLGDTLCKGCRVAKTHEGFVALAVEVERVGGSTPRQLTNLLYHPPRALEVTSDGAPSRIEHLATLVCLSQESALQDAFLRLAGALFDAGDVLLTERALEERLDDLVDLFRSLSRPATCTIQGLWAELVVILWSSDVKRALVSWHSSPRDTFDFEDSYDRIEVKSCSTGLREHAVTLEQLTESPPGRTLLLSLVVEADPDGDSVTSLCDAISERIAGEMELQRRLVAIVTRSLGRDWTRAATETFSQVRAREALRIYPVTNVPTIPPPIPSEISKIKFTVDLSTAISLSLQKARTLGSFFEGFLPNIDQPASTN